MNTALMRASLPQRARQKPGVMLRVEVGVARAGAGLLGLLVCRESTQLQFRRHRFEQGDAVQMVDLVLQAAAEQAIAGELMAIIGEFAAIMECGPASSEAQALVHKLQAFITEHYYTCSADVLAGLGKAYGAGGEFTANINASAGEGVAEFAAEAIAVYCA